MMTITSLAALVAAIALAGCDGNPGAVTPDAGTDGAAEAPQPPPPPGTEVNVHWTLISPDPSLIPGHGGCYKLADEAVTIGSSLCASLPSQIAPPDDRCSVTCSDGSSTSAAVVLTCGICTGQYAVSIVQ